jgi:prepilin-type N-terminal cleavage/methylation domain-containing protein
MSTHALEGERERGYTLTEVLVAVSILAVAVVVIVGAIGSSIFASGVHRDIVTSDAVVRRYAEQLVAKTTVYVSCAAPAQYPALANPPTGYSAAITDVDYWNGSSSPATFDEECTTDAGVQKITVQAQRTDGAGLQTLQFVKRSSTP